MKRKDNLYKAIYNIENIQKSYKEVCQDTRNQRRVLNLKEYKNVYISRIHQILVNKKYLVCPYNHFIIYEPKRREIVSQNVYDKIINHLVVRHILYLAVVPCLLDCNVTSGKNMGTLRGINLAMNFINKCNIKYKNYYILKCDISKFFSNIDHDILKEKLNKKIKDKDALKIVFDIIDSNNKGLFIGTMSSQILAIFYLNDLDHYIKEELKIKYYVRYQDDFLLFHESKEYLKYCLLKITNFLKKEKLELISKTGIYKNTNNFIFLSRNKKGNYSRYRNIKRKLKKRYKLYKNKNITLGSFISSLRCYESLCNKNNLFKLHIH